MAARTRTGRPFAGSSLLTYLCDDIPSDYEPQYHYLFRRIDDYRGDIRLAVFYCCKSGLTDPYHDAGNLAEAAARAGAESVLGFDEEVSTSDRGYYWECALWLHLASEDDNEGPPTLSAACDYADELCEVHFFPYTVEDYNLKPRYCLGTANWGQTLWPAG